MGSTLIEVFGHIVVSFTRGVVEHYNPKEPEFTAESLSYSRLGNTGLEWNYLPVDELIYQEYSDREARTLDYQTGINRNVRVLDACSLEENDEIQAEQQEEDRAMAWKRLRPSALRTVCKSMVMGALISLLTSSVLGSLYMILTYLTYKTQLNCLFNSKDTIPEKIQWINSISAIITCFFLDMWFSVNIVFLFRPYQVMGLKGRLFLVSFLFYCLDALYRVTLHALDRASLNEGVSLRKTPPRLSLAIVTHYQNMAVMAVWGKRWKRHTLVAIINAVFASLWSSGYCAEVLHVRFGDDGQPCKMPFSEVV